MEKMKGRDSKRQAEEPKAPIIHAEKVPGKVIHLNKEIEAAGKRKKLGEALGYFKQIEKYGYQPTVVSYTSAINACVRCDEVPRALRIFEIMKSKNVTPNVITYTALLKGLCSTNLPKDLLTARNLLLELQNNKISTNFRTFNTFLRGCQRLGDIQSLPSVFQHYLSDAASGEFSVICAFVQLYSQALDIHAAREALHQWTSSTTPPPPPSSKRPRPSSQKESKDNTPLPARYALCLALCLLHRHPEAQKQLQRLLRTIRSSISSSALFLGDVSSQRTGDFEEKRSNEAPVAFLKLKRKEYVRRIEKLSRFLEMWKGEEKEKLEERKTEYWRLFSSQLCRTFYVAPGEGERENGFSYFGEAVRNWESFGVLGAAREMQEWFEMGEEKERKEGRGEKERREEMEKRVGKKGKKVMRALLRDYRKRFFNDERTLNLRRVFGKDKTHIQEYKAEICSGLGDWVIDTAKAEPNVGWFALELRNDRCASTFANAILDGVENVCIVGGDAIDNLQQMFSPLLTEVWVNFPEPPSNSSEHHLLDSRLLKIVHEKLTPNGILRIVTDSSTYVRTIALEIQAMIKEGIYEICSEEVALKKDAPVVTEGVNIQFSDSEEEEEEGEGEGEKGEKGEEREGEGEVDTTGIAPEMKIWHLGLPQNFATSFFDRFWTNGDKARRYTIAVRAVKN